MRPLDLQRNITRLTSNLTIFAYSKKLSLSITTRSITPIKYFTMSAIPMHRTRKEIPPPVHRGMKKLDREAFKAKVKCLAVRVDEKAVGALSKNKVVQRYVTHFHYLSNYQCLSLQAYHLNSQVLSMSRRRAIEADPNTSTNKLLLLDVENEGMYNISDLFGDFLCGLSGSH